MITLYGSAGSPFVSRVRMMAYAKQLSVELSPAALGTPGFLQMNPIGKMPVLEHDGLFVPESAVICEYLEEAFPTPRMLGATIEERMRSRLIVRTLDLYCGGAIEILRSKTDPNHRIDLTARRAELARGLDALVTFMVDEGYAVGGALSLADCALVPWLFYATMLTPTGEDALSSRPRLVRYIDFIGQHELTQRIWGEMDVAYKGFLARWRASQASAQTG
jgi:glutathione S-transferase